MRRRYDLLYLVLPLLCSSQVQAIPKPVRDPQVIIAGGTGSFPVGSPFLFISPTGTSPINLLNGSPCVIDLFKISDCLFKNASGFKWKTLTFTISPGGQKGPFTCLALIAFLGCNFNKQGTQVTFFGGLGLANGQDFVVEVLLWGPGTSFQATGSGDSSAQRELSAPQPAVATSRLQASLATFIDIHGAWLDRRRRGAFRPARRRSLSPALGA